MSGKPTTTPLPSGTTTVEPLPAPTAPAFRISLSEQAADGEVRFFVNGRQLPEVGALTPPERLTRAARYATIDARPEDRAAGGWIRFVLSGDQIRTGVCVPLAGLERERIDGGFYEYRVAQPLCTAFTHDQRIRSIRRRARPALFRLARWPQSRGLPVRLR